VRIMVVDDSRQIRRHVGRTLLEFGHETLEAEHGQICLDLLCTEQVDVILLDWNMPVMDGLETLKAIKNDANLKNIKVIMMTTENKDEKIELALQSGADEYIMKPLTKEVISEKLESLNDDFI
jgi:two-component system, chemotaxis family, chemotaxis protein CheY